MRLTKALEIKYIQKVESESNEDLEGAKDRFDEFRDSQPSVFRDSTLEEARSRFDESRESLPDALPAVICRSDENIGPNDAVSLRVMGIAGLFSDRREIVGVQPRQSEGTMIAAPSVCQSHEIDLDGPYPWDDVDIEIEEELAICAIDRFIKLEPDDEGLIPAMPCLKGGPSEPHRPKIMGINSHSWVVMNACVARPVGRKEMIYNPPATASMDAEWNRLRTKSFWDESLVREWSEVAREAQEAEVEVNFGYLFGICVEKNSELARGHPKRKFKGRVVFQGNRVTNQDWEAAIFQDLGSCSATMGASKAADLYGLTFGFAAQIADAGQAYIQAELNGTPRWICLPPEARPKSYAKYT